MTLTTHSIIAAAVAKPLINSHPILIFLTALASHYLADAIPHWDYRLRSIVENENMTNKEIILRRPTFGIDFLRTATDAILGLLIVTFLVWPASLHEWVFVALTVIGGVLPDFLQGIHYGLRLKFLRPHQRFHDFIHAKIKLGYYPLIGIPFQLIIVLIAFYILLQEVV